MSNIHDETFKQLMSQKQFFMAFFKQYLPAKVFNTINWAKTKVFKLSGEHIREVFPFDGGEKVKIAKDLADLAYIVEQKKGGQALITLHVEHQSTPDKLMPLRLALYLLGALYEYAKMNKTDKLPQVYSVIYYHGKKTPYPYAKDLTAMFDKTYLAEHLFKPAFVDLGQIPDSELMKRKTLSAAEIAFKHIFEKNLEPYVQIIADSIRNADDNTRSDVLKYLLSAGEASSEKFIKGLSSALKDEEKEVMTIAEQLQQKKAIEIAENMAQEGADIKFIKKVTKLSDAALKKAKILH